MSARMSSDRRIGRLPSHPLRYETSLSEPAATFMDSLAYDEARSILADAEPRQEQGMSGHWPCGRPNMAWQADRFCYDESGYLSGTGWLAHAALAESLRSFVEGN